MNKFLYALLITAIVLPLSGCTGPTPQPTVAVLPTATPLPEPTAILEPTPTPQVDPIQQIDQLLTDMNAKKQFNGIALIAKDGEVLLHNAYGMADYDKNIPLEKDAPMPLLTFDLEAASILLLNYQGKLSLEDPVCTYLPDCPENWKSLTVNNILYHSWGIQHDKIYENIASQVDWWRFWLSPTRYEQIISKIGENPINELKAPADAYWSWMNYALQDEIIEQVTGSSPGEYMIKNILEPLGITSLGKNFDREALPTGLAYYIRRRSTEPYPSNAVFPYFPIATIEDIYKLSQEYLDPKVLPVEVVNGLRKEVQYVDGSGYSGMNLIGNTNLVNWRKYPQLKGKSVNWWLYSMGYSGAQFISFDDQIVIILFTNEGGREYADLIQKIYVNLIED